jgi:hypothetical protein
MAESYRTSAALGDLVAGLGDLAAIERADARSYEVVHDPGCERARLRPSGGACGPGQLLVLSLTSKMLRRLLCAAQRAGCRPRQLGAKVA